MTGSVGEDEDIVQDAFLGLTRARQAGTTIADPKAYLTTVVSRLGINYLSSARVRRETYVGDWLPEPVVVPAGGPGPAGRRADRLAVHGVPCVAGGPLAGGAGGVGTAAAGRFTSYDVTIVTSEDPRGSSVAATIDLASIGTGSEPRDNHLRSADYFEVGKYPTMSYRFAGIRRTDDGWVIDGELTLHGVTRQVPLAVEVNGFGPDLRGGQRAGFSATAQISRRDFGIDISILIDGGGVAVGDKVSVSLEIEAVLQK
jgi:polyisoprenoid-binding protein YceI